jgi:LPS sulfotransferase NodH
MRRPFDLFIIFAGMRTGSNFLETNLNAVGGIRCYGEAFNPHFIGYPKRGDILGITQTDRDRSPMRLIEAIRNQDDALGGFRYFHDHDPRILDEVLDDPRCAKISLTRNPIDSYVSTKIARTTGQWKLTKQGARKSDRAMFDADEFAAHLDEIRMFRRLVTGRLQRTGQTAFHVDYEDLRDVRVINGVARYLGVPGRLDTLDATMKVQNPAPLSEKVENFAEMEAALAALDPFDLGRSMGHERQLGPRVRHYVAAQTIPLLFLPIDGGPTDEVTAWLSAIKTEQMGAIETGMNQRDLRAWKRNRPGHRSFTVLRHPVARAHRLFCDRILSRGPDSLPQLRRTLVRHHGLPVPEDGIDGDWDVAKHRVAFARFLEFLKLNLRTQTAVRVHPGWASQSVALQGLAEFASPDFVLRECGLGRDLPDIARRLDVVDPPPYRPASPTHPIALEAIYDDEIEGLARAAYQRDYVTFGFGRWSGA